MRLNGWQRLWVVASAASLVAIGAVLLITQPNATSVDDPAILARLMADETKTAEIEGIGLVKFPSDIEDKEIARYVKEGMSTSPPTVGQIAARLFQERAERSASEGHALNEAMRNENRNTWLYSIGAWAGVSLLLYVLGCAFNWIYRGFRKPQCPRPASRPAE